MLAVEGGKAREQKGIVELRLAHSGHLLKALFIANLEAGRGVGIHGHALYTLGGCTLFEQFVA